MYTVTGLELRLQAAHGQIVLGDHDEPGGILIQPVHDAGASLAAHTGDAGAVVQHGIDQRAALCPGAGCTTMPAGLSITSRF